MTETIESLWCVSQARSWHRQDIKEEYGTEKQTDRRTDGQTDVQDL